jgi:hypothetical protein
MSRNSDRVDACGWNRAASWLSPSWLGRASIRAKPPDARPNSAALAVVPREPPHRENPRYRNGEDGAGVRVPPADINGKDLNPMVKAARVNNTPEQLVARLAEANDTNYVGTSLTRRRQG